MASRKGEKERLRQERLAREQAAAHAARRRRLFQLYGGGGAAIVAIVVVVVVILASGGGNPSKAGGTASAPHLKTTSLAGMKLTKAPPLGPIGPEGIPIAEGQQLASNSSMATGQTVDGVSCAPIEQLAYHVHTHLTIFVNGTARQIPYGIGIAPPRQLQQSSTGPFVTGGSCFYWLHTHADDGIIHIESPTNRVYTLGDFFDIWRQPLGPNQVGPAKGKVTAFYNGRLYEGNPRDIPLGSHHQIQLDVGTPLVAPETVSFSGTGL